MSNNNFFIKPLITEKSSVSIEDRKFTFYVNKLVNKITIKSFIEDNFNVKVESVNTNKIPSKKRRRGRTTGKTVERKKAIVTICPKSNLESIKSIF